MLEQWKEWMGIVDQHSAELEDMGRCSMYRKLRAPGPTDLQEYFQEVFAEDKAPPDTRTQALRWLFVSKVMDLLSSSALTGKLATTITSNLVAEVVQCIS